MIKKIAIISLAVLLLLAFLFGALAYFGVFLDKDTLGREETLYYVDENGERVQNIPYADYVENLTAPTDGIIPSGLSESNTAEENGKIINDCITLLPKNGTVIIPNGSYKTTTVYLKSNMTLFVSKNAQLLSPTYEENKNSSIPLDEGVIYAKECENVTVTGGGTVCGEGLTYTNEAKNSSPLYALEKFNTYLRVIEARKRIRTAKTDERKHILKFYNCKNVSVNNVVLKDSAYWTAVFENCFDVAIYNLVINNNYYIANSDGIDILGGENYDISHCFIATGDDAIVIKSPKFPTKAVSINACALSSAANCFKIGTETQYDVEEVTLKDCYFFMPSGMTYGYSGIAIESCDGANVKNIAVENVTMDGISAPLLIWLGKRFKYDKKEVGSINGVSIKNVEAVNVEMPSAVTGCQDKGVTHYVENVNIENFTAVYRDTKEQLNIRKKVGEYTMQGYPDVTRVSHVYILSHETSRYWDLPCYALLIKHAKNINYGSLSVIPRSTNQRNALYLDDVI